jgi:two-component system, OmpR family, sensor kinase
MSDRRPPVPLRHRLVLRVYRFGLGLLVAFALAALLLLSTVLPQAEGPVFGGAELVLRDSLAHSPDLAARARELAGSFDRVASFYRADGTLLASAGRPLPPLDADALAELSRAPRHAVRVDTDVRVAEVQGERVVRYGIMRLHPPEPGLVLPSILAGVFLALSLFSIPFARSIVRPLEALADVVRRFGAGDHRARSSAAARSDEVGALATVFNEMAVRVEAARRFERDLLANVSHELRTPLARIRVVLELAASTDADAVQRYLADIGEDLAEIDVLIDAVLTAARLDGPPEAPYTPRQPGPVDLALLLREVGERFRTHEREHRIGIAGAGAAVILGERALLRRAVENLLSNALKYSAPDTVVEATVLCEEAAVELSIVDHGIGISESDQRQLFTPFFRADPSRSRGTGGIGLGLVITKRIVEAHGGTIAVTSAIGAGTRVTVRFPISAPRPERAAAQ